MLRHHVDDGKMSWGRFLVSIGHLSVTLILLPNFRDMARFVGWFNPEIVPTDHGQSVECALSNATFSSDMDVILLYLFNDETPTPEQTLSVIEIQRKVDDFMTFPLKARLRNPWLALFELTNHNTNEYPTTSYYCDWSIQTDDFGTCSRRLTNTLPKLFPDGSGQSNTYATELQKPPPPKSALKLLISTRKQTRLTSKTLKMI